MKYTEMSKTSSTLTLDYKTPLWLIPIVIVCVGLSIFVVFLSFAENRPWWQIALIILFTLFIPLLFLEYFKKRPLEIDLVQKMLRFDGLEVSFSDITDVVSMRYRDAKANNLLDENAPHSTVSYKQEATTYETYLLFSDGKSLRVYQGFKGKSEDEVNRFKAYLNLK